MKFINTMGANDMDKMPSFFDKKSVLNNIPMKTVRGAENIWGILGLMHDIAVSVEYVIHNIAESSEGVVLTERTDRYQLKILPASFP